MRTRPRCRTSFDELRPAVDPLRRAFASIDRKQEEYPAKGVVVIVQAWTVSGICEGRKLSKRLALGEDAVGCV